MADLVPALGPYIFKLSDTLIDGLDVLDGLDGSSILIGISGLFLIDKSYFDIGLTGFIIGVGISVGIRDGGGLCGACVGGLLVGVIDICVDIGLNGVIIGAGIRDGGGLCGACVGGVLIDVIGICAVYLLLILLIASSNCLLISL